MPDAPYSFAPYLKARGTDPWRSDPLLQAWVRRSRPTGREVDWLRQWSRDVSGTWAARADEAEQAANLPRLAGKGPHDDDRQAVVLPAGTVATLGEVHGSVLWRADLGERLRYAAVYLLNQNGEAGVACSVACTDGLIRVLRKQKGHAPLAKRLASMSADGWLHAAQFVTEAQGGSDAATNQVRAEPNGDGSFALHGLKWFCSNPTADWWLVTARSGGAPAGSKGVGLFLVESAAGGWTFERLKDKVGTRALATAEVRFHGARARPVGPPGEGLRTMVADVLVPSRIHNVVAVAGFLRRAQREASAYAAFRMAFGKRLESQPLLADALGRLGEAADRAEAGAFATVDAWLESLAPKAKPEQILLARVLVSLHKAVATRRAPALLHEAISVLGGNGIEERFSVLPRLWRDSIILETWEGPYTLLLVQALGDLRRGGAKGQEEAFVKAWAGRPHRALARELAAVVAGRDDRKAMLRWKALATRLVEAWEERALASLR
ncbi:MAG TPA: acyl-CoA dehydrogenase family protein [Candidatus Thermoplasmatota archaeon]|nr:acyl-CoA dehydrogenase family protein [Candidatus Thermoplasmatota archaeon]